MERDRSIGESLHARPGAPGAPEGMKETSVWQHVSEVKVGPEQRLVERLDLVMSDGDIRQLDIPGEPGEPFDEGAFAQRREAALRRLAEEDDVPSILGRQFVLWTPENGGPR